MVKKIKNYLKIQAIISAAFNFFINGMIVALIYHKADTVSADTAGIAAAVFFFGTTAPVFALLKIRTLSLGVYVALKCTFAALLGGTAALEIYVGMYMSHKRL